MRISKLLSRGTYTSRPSAIAVVSSQYHVWQYMPLDDEAVHTHSLYESTSVAATLQRSSLRVRGDPPAPLSVSASAVSYVASRRLYP